MGMYELIKEKVDKLNEARKAYEQYDIELMTNAEYDTMYYELEALEKETGIILPDSPTQNVGYEIESDLPTEPHVKKMLSMRATKDIDVLKEFAGDKMGILSWKVDGITLVLTYEEGKLTKVLTRGNGEVGEVITETARKFSGIPHEISFKRHVVLRGEAHITYSRYEELDKVSEEVDAIYKNPRNLCSATVRQLDLEVAAKRGVEFIAFAVIEAEDVNFKNSRLQQLNWLSILGFNTVDRLPVFGEIIDEAVNDFRARVFTYDVPADGMVFMFDDIAYSESLGETPKYPLDSIAYKWADETAKVRLDEVAWNVTERGFINPVARFTESAIEGKKVSEAPLHNLSVIKQMKLGIGDEIEVYLADMVIPQVLQNNTKTDSLVIPDTCPVCGGKTEIKIIENSEILVCSNPDCQAKG